MDIEYIETQLNGRFNAPLPEYYRRRIIFWQDEEREFEDKLDDIHLDNAKLIGLTGSNTFMVKKLLSNDDLSSNYLVYNPLSFEKPDDDWLIDIVKVPTNNVKINQKRLYARPFWSILFSISYHPSLELLLSKRLILYILLSRL